MNLMNTIGLKVGTPSMHLMQTLTEDYSTVRGGGFTPPFFDSLLNEASVNDQWLWEDYLLSEMQLTLDTLPL
jgi:hypothetical protein